MAIDVVVADDLTGAADTLVQFLACAETVLVYLSPEGFERAAAAGELNGRQLAVAISSRSRHLLPAEAAAAVHAVHASAARLVPRLWFQKVDSALRGNPGAEVAAYRDATHAERVLLCPAFLPSRRTVRAGVLYVDGVTLSESPLARDVRSPSSTSSVAEIMGRTSPAGISNLAYSADAGVLRRAFARTPPGIVVADAETDADLVRLAGLAFDAGLLDAVAGSAGLAGVIASEMPRVSRRRSVAMHSSGATRSLVVFGSPQPTARRQLAFACSALNLGPTRVAPDTPPAAAVEAVGRSLRDHGVALVTSPDEELTDPDAPEKIAARLAAVAAEVVASCPVDSLVLSGGDVAAAVCDALGAESLELLGQVFPGAPISRVRGGYAAERTLVTKSGTHGDERGLLAILEALGAVSGTVTGESLLEERDERRTAGARDQHRRPGGNRP